MLLIKRACKKGPRKKKRAIERQRKRKKCKVERKCFKTALCPHQIVKRGQETERINKQCRR